MQLERLFQEPDAAVQKALAALCQELVGAVSNICSSVSLPFLQLYHIDQSLMRFPTVPGCYASFMFNLLLEKSKSAALPRKL